MTTNDDTIAPIDLQPLDKAREELDSALTKIYGLADVLQTIRDPDLGETLAYLAAQLQSHQEEASDAFGRIFGLNEYSEQRGGPGPLLESA